MSKTVHPYAFRIGGIRGWKSRWFNGKKYRHFLKTDVLIREWLEKKLRGMYIESIDMERSPNIFHLIIKTSRPGLLIGRKGEGSEKLKSEIKKKLVKSAEIISDNPRLGLVEMEKILRIMKDTKYSCEVCKKYNKDVLNYCDTERVC